MKTKCIATIAAIAFLPMAGFAQPVPPVPPQPPIPAQPPERHERMPRVPAIFLGVETSTIPSVLCEQMNLPKGFGLVVDYVVPDGPAAAAGVLQNDIIKMLNDQILMEPNQLRKLLQSFPEGTTVTLTLLRKGQEQKISVKLVKKEVPKRNALLGHDGNWDFNFNPDFDFDFNVGDMGDLKEKLKDLKADLKDQLKDQKGMFHDTVMKASEEVRRARDEVQRAAGQINIRSSDNGSMKTTKIDIGKAQIVFSDDKGELKVEPVDGKKVLTAKDPQGKLLFSGPVETKEDLDKVPADVRQRFEKLQNRDIPSVTFSNDDDDADVDDGDDDNGASTDQVSFTSAPRKTGISNAILI
jgi:membrane-associated protease RseP (regulator of RpoE activity)